VAEARAAVLDRIRSVMALRPRFKHCRPSRLIAKPFHKRLAERHFRALFFTRLIKHLLSSLLVLLREASDLRSQLRVENL